MNKDKKPDLKLVKKETPLTIKQKTFVDNIVRGKIGTYKESYTNAYDVTMNKDGSTPKWVEVEASKLLANPKIAQSLMRAYEARERTFTASSLRTKNYVLEELYKQSKSTELTATSSTQIRALELLGRSCKMFVDVQEEIKSRDTIEIERDIETKLDQLLSEADS